MVEKSPPGSAYQRAIDPDWWLTPEAFLLREVEHQVRILQWMQTENAAKKRMNTYPQPIPLSDVERRRFERENEQYQFDSLPLEAARARLGWN